MNHIRAITTLLGLAALAGAATAVSNSRGEAPARAAHGDVERGRYLTLVAGCNDCHTPGYAEAAGQVPESQWLIGDAVGWQGPWGTTYATNLRLRLAQMSEPQWLAYARAFQPRPPMPWFNVHAMTEEDLRAFYRYVRHLGPAGRDAPAYVPPGQPVAGPVISFPAPPPGVAH